MCLAAKHLLWFPVLFCQFNLLICWSVYIFFYSSLFPCSTLRSYTEFSIQIRPQPCMSCLGMFLSLGLAGWPVAFGLVLLALAACHSAGCKFSKRNWCSSAFCCCLFLTLICTWSENTRVEERRCLPRALLIPPLLCPGKRTSQPAPTAQCSPSVLPALLWVLSHCQGALEPYPKSDVIMKHL